MSRVIGLLGGTSWVSTIDYYRYLNQRVQARRGEAHSASLLLKSIDYAPLVSRYRDDWPGARALFAEHLAGLAALGPDCLMVCCNTLHRALDELAPAERPDVPIIHMVDETIARARTRGDARLLLLGTRFTMENGYYEGRLADAGFEVVLPDAANRETIQAFQSRAAAGESCPKAAAWFDALLARHASCDAAVLACTELPGLVDTGTAAIGLLDPLTIQCDAALAFVDEGG